MSSSDSEYSKLSNKRHSKSKSRDKRGKDKIRSRERKRKHSRSKERKHRHSPSLSSESGHNRRHRSRSRDRKGNRHEKYKSRIDDEIKMKQDRRKRKYDNEIDSMKSKEIDKRREVEDKRKKDQKEKEIEDKKQQEKLKKMKERELTEEEKLEIKRQSRRAKAKLMLMIETEEEKKFEQSTLHSDRLEEDFLNQKDNFIDELEKIGESNTESIIMTTINIESEIKKDEQMDVEEDPLDAYMKTIQSESNLQDYQISQIMYNMQLQKRYDEIAGDSELEEKQDTVMMIEDFNQNHIDESKIITLDDIIGKKLSDDNFDEDEFHKKFVESFKGVKAPDIDPLYGYSEEKKEIVLYREDVNEYLKDEDFEQPEDTWQKLKKMGEKKELKLVNHAEINYEAFRKNLYRESKEISSLSKEEVEHIRKQMGDIKVRGKNIPKPVNNWYQCGLSDRILAVLERKSFKNPFPIQCQSMPAIMTGRDIIGIAETGSGKTLAYVLPMLRHILDQRPLKVYLLF